jgi:hypothetical protein
MTRKIILAVIFTAGLVANYSFTSSTSAKAVSTIAQNDKKWIIVCLYTNGCRYCGGVMWDRSLTTVCTSTLCPGQYTSICVTFASKIDPVSGKDVVDESSVEVSYSDPAVKAATDEGALKADFIQQVNAQL